jgi:hypothetical protein
MPCAGRFPGLWGVRRVSECSDSPRTLRGRLWPAVGPAVATPSAGRLSGRSAVGGPGLD